MQQRYCNRTHNGWFVCNSNVTLVKLTIDAAIDCLRTFLFFVDSQKSKPFRFSLEKALWNASNKPATKMTQQNRLLDLLLNSFFSKNFAWFAVVDSINFIYHWKENGFTIEFPFEWFFLFLFSFAYAQQKHRRTTWINGFWKVPVVNLNAIFNSFILSFRNKTKQKNNRNKQIANETKIITNKTIVF